MLLPSPWVEGTDFHFIDGNQWEWKYTGTFVANKPTAKVGSCWVEGEYFCYIDANNDKRRIEYLVISTPSGVEGSAWVEGSFWHWLSEATHKKIRGHTDAAHLDAHGDSAHTNTHGDVSHANVPYDDAHGDSHTNVPHGDEPHADEYYADDILGGEIHVDERASWIDFHVDAEPYNYYANSGTGDHMTSHDDSPEVYVPHGDVPHSDSHDDSPHSDSPHTNTHGDTAHTNTHSNAGHQDQPVRV